MSLGRQIGGFLVSGVAASGVHYASFVALVAAGALPPALANVAGIALGTLVSYVANSAVSFGAPMSRGTLLRFLVVTAIGGGLGTAVVEGWVRLGLHYALAGGAGIVAGATFNFVGHRHFTFRGAAA